MGSSRDDLLSKPLENKKSRTEREHCTALHSIMALWKKYKKLLFYICWFPEYLLQAN